MSWVDKFLYCIAFYHYNCKEIVILKQWAFYGPNLKRQYTAFYETSPVFIVDLRDSSVTENDLEKKHFYLPKNITND